MANNHYYTYPLGVKSKSIPQAEIANNKNSIDLVHDAEADAFYFRSLEQQGLYLNQPQIKAVRHYQGPLLALAGAGSGKTSVLVCRTGYLISVQQVHPQQILLVTYTKKAAEEMKERIATLPRLTKKMAEQVEVRTFHSFFLKILRSRGYEQKILSNERYKQIIIKQILREMGVQDAYQPETILSLLSSYKMNILSLDDLPDKTPVDKEMNQISSKYEQWKKENDWLDFDDILLESYYLLLNQPSLLQAIQKRFVYIMVDEFQDTNYLQYELIKMIAKKHKNLFVVGDDDQTIYSFNGARNEFILHFDKEFPYAQTVTLDINYRSTQGIVGLGNDVICHNRKRKVKTLQSTKRSEFLPKYKTPSSTDEEAALIVEQINAAVMKAERRYSDYAILHRTENNSRAIFEQLALEKIPFIHYSMGDQIFYDQWTIKPVIEHLRLSLNHRNMEAIAGIISTLYINQHRGMEIIHTKELSQPKKYPLIHLASLPEMKEYQVKKIKERIHLLREINELKPLVAIKRIRDEFYDKFLETDERHHATIHKETLKETLDELESSAELSQPKKYPLIHLASLPEMKEYQVKKIKERIHLLREINELKLLVAIKRIRDEFYDKFLETDERHHATIHKETLKETLDELESSASRFETVVEFINFIDNMTHVQQEMAQLKKEPQANAVSVMTIHRAKGLEFPVVFLIGASEGILPHVSAIDADRLEDKISAKQKQEKVSEAIEEERRLMYVAITRAKDELYISSPSFYRGKRAEVSRFLLEAFPSDYEEIPQCSNHSASRYHESSDHEQRGTKETVLAWICTGDGCIAWQRVATDDAELQEKECPLCDSPMMRGSKEL